jgi:hypothetical protein
MCLVVQVKRQVRERLEKLRKSKSKVSRVMNPEELGKITQPSSYETVARHDNLLHQMTNQIEGDVEDAVEAESPDNITGIEIMQSWVNVLMEMEDEAFDEAAEEFANNEWEDMQEHDDGREHRERYPYPTMDCERTPAARRAFPQEKLSGSRAKKHPMQMYDVTFD